MKKLLTIVLGSLLTFGTYAQENGESRLKTTFGFESQRVHRGVGFGTSPSIGGKISYDFCNWFALSSEGITTTNTSNIGLNSSLENVATIKHKDFNLSVSDMYFFVNGAENNYFDYGKSTNHLVNATLKYTKKEDDKNVFYCLAQSTIHKSDTDENNGLYFEAGYNLTDHLQLTAGYVTDASTFNFRTKEGITQLGLTACKDVKIGSEFKPKMSAGLFFNPSYKNVFDVTGLNNNPVQFNVGFSF